MENSWSHAPFPRLGEGQGMGAEYQSYSRYSYCYNNPLKYSDPSGYNAWKFEENPYQTFSSNPGVFRINWNICPYRYDWNTQQYYNSKGEVVTYDEVFVNYIQPNSISFNSYLSSINSGNIKHSESKGNQQNQVNANNFLADLKKALLDPGGMMFNGSWDDVLETNPNLDLTNTPWMDTALGEYYLGVKEEPLGSNSGPRVDEYLKYAGKSAPNAWCAAFVNWCLGQNNIKGAGALGNNYLNWGTKLDVPTYGAIVIFKSYHLGFYMGENADGTLKILHGNWSNKVTISSGIYDPIKPDQILEYRFPLNN